MDKFLVKKRSAEDSVQPPPTKKSKPATKFNSSHSQEFSFMKSSQKRFDFSLKIMKNGENYHSQIPQFMHMMKLENTITFNSMKF